jgi:hypothetical protein
MTTELDSQQLLTSRRWPNMQGLRRLARETSPSQISASADERGVSRSNSDLSAERPYALYRSTLSRLTYEAPRGGEAGRGGWMGERARSTRSNRVEGKGRGRRFLLSLSLPPLLLTSLSLSHSSVSLLVLSSLADLIMLFSSFTMSFSSAASTLAVAADTHTDSMSCAGRSVVRPIVFLLVQRR